jgi:hypothetical protein
MSNRRIRKDFLLVATRQFEQEATERTEVDLLRYLCFLLFKPVLLQFKTDKVLTLGRAHGRVDGADSSFFDRMNRILQDCKHRKVVSGNPVESC